DLGPGSYTLLARANGVAPISAQGGVRTETVPTFFPSVVDRVQAVTINLAAGADQGGYDIRLQASRVYRVRGVVLDIEGKPADKAVVELLPGFGNGHWRDPSFLEFGTTRQIFSIVDGPSESRAPEGEPVVTGKDGIFEFPSVREGNWAIRAESDV